ncbi:MAG: CpsD/CapB family tyrosine-protein kinase, partial [Gemmatimonadaceae bacterium]|nr:CpsD/CapB family tyrosine-protein kinase [Gloeobacterales cyanobacterium ES-bin-141]
QVLDQPTVDPKPSSPKLSLIALGALLASALGSIALALLLEGRNPLLGPKDLQGVEFPVLARIPLLKGPALESDLEAETGVEFQRLASAVSLMPIENGRLMVSSSSFGEGKTTVTLGLAIALADLGFRVLLVDGDFRRAELSRRLGFTREGVLQSMLVHLRPDLDLVPTIPRQRRVMELVARGRFERSLETLHESGEYDYVLIDSAPLGLTSESALMAAAVRNVLLVIRPGTSDRNMVNDSIEQLAQHNARIIGLTINGVQTRSEGYRYARNIAQGNA